MSVSVSVFVIHPQHKNRQRAFLLEVFLGNGHRQHAIQIALAVSRLVAVPFQVPGEDTCLAEIKRQTFPQPEMLPEVTVISKEMVSGNGQNNNTIDSNTNTMNSNTSEAPFGNIQVSDSVVDQLNNEVGRAVTSGDAPSDNANTESLEDKETDDFLDEVHKKKISDEIRERKREEKLHRESIAQDSLISRNIKTVPSGNDQSHVTSKTEVSVEQDDDMIPEESLDENQIVEQGLIHELCSSISPEDNVSSTKIISSCFSLENMISGSAQHLSYLFETAIKSSQQEILDWHNYSFEFESKVGALTADGRIKDKTARSMIYKEMKPFLPTKITQANLRKKTHRARKHLMLFGKNGVGIDKIKLASYSATEILKLTNAQIQNVINQVKKYTSEHQSHVTLKTVPSGNDQIKAKVSTKYIGKYIIFTSI